MQEQNTGESGLEVEVDLEDDSELDAEDGLAAEQNTDVVANTVTGLGEETPEEDAAEAEIDARRSDS